MRAANAIAQPMERRALPPSTGVIAGMLNVVAGERAEILLIDDDALALASAAAALESVGHIVYEARDRLAALRTARNRALDLVICDLSVAGENGLELCRELRRLPGMPDVPVMFVSRTQLPDIVRRSHEAGAAYFLRKPLDPEVLVDLVGKALWMPHLVQSRLSMHERAAQPMPPPQSKHSVRQAAVQGIRLPLA
jgi:two-component system chemotaxis response regulator CheY